MPFRRRNNRRRRTRRPRRRFRGRRMMRRTRRVALDPERKDYDLGFAAQLIDTFGVARSLNTDIAQGITETQRIGNQVLMTSILVKYHVTVGASTANSLLRVALVWFKQPAGSVFAINQLWTDVGTLGATIAPRTLNTALKFKVLWSRTHTLSLDQSNIQRTMFMRMRRKSRYSGAAGSVAQQQTGGLYWVSISNIPVAAGADLPIITIRSRLRFVG